MPNRTLKESICTSKRFNRLSIQGQMLYLRLIVNCDDYGRWYAEPEVVRSHCYPYGNMNQDVVTAALNELEAAGMVVTYTHDDTTYLEVSAWMEHNTPRAKQSKYPGPDDDGCMRLHADVCRCLQMHADVSARARVEHEVDNEVDNEVVVEVGRAPDGAPPTNNSSEPLPDMTPLEEEIAELKGWGPFAMDDRAWLEKFLSDCPTALDSDVRHMGAHWYAKAEKDKKVIHSKTQWKLRMRTWLKRKGMYEGGSNGHRGLPGNAPTGAFADIETG